MFGADEATIHVSLFSCNSLQRCTYIYNTVVFWTFQFNIYCYHPSPIPKMFFNPLTSHKLLSFDIPPMNSCIRNWNILFYMFKQLVSYMYRIRLFNTGQADEAGYSTLKKLSSSHPPFELCPASSPEPNFIVCLCQNAHSDVVDCISNLILEIAPQDAARSPQFLKKLGFFAKTDVDCLNR